MLGEYGAKNVFTKASCCKCGYQDIGVQEGPHDRS